MREEIVPFLCLILTLYGAIAGCIETPDKVDDTDIQRTFDLRNHTIHDVTEGIIVPISDENLQLLKVDLEIRPSFWTCMVFNYDFHINSSYFIYNPSSKNARSRLGFPCTSHVLSGDHYEEEDIQVTIDGSGIDHSWAYNDDIYYHPSLLKDKNSSEEVRGRNELMGFDERISEFIPIFDISPVLHNEGVEFLAYFNIEVEGKSTVRIDIDLTHFSGFACTGDCDHSNGHLKLDLDHSGHWDAPPMFDITIMNNSQPKITTSLNVTYDSSVYRLHGNDTSLPLDIRISPRIQTAEGYVFDEWGAPLPGVDIISDETGSRTISNVTGYFRIELGYFSSERITFSKVGYEAITLSFIDFEGEVFLKKK